jgi:hypothetical protein
VKRRAKYGWRLAQTPYNPASSLAVYVAQRPAGSICETPTNSLASDTDALQCILYLWLDRREFPYCCRGNPG